MAVLKICVSLVHALRKQHQIKVRQPLQRILIPLSKTQDIRTILAPVEELLRLETNVKHIQYIDGLSDIVIKTIKPNKKRLENLALLVKQRLFEVLVR